MGGKNKDFIGPLRNYIYIIFFKGPMKSLFFSQIQFFLFCLIFSEFSFFFSSFFIFQLRFSNHKACLIN